MQTRLLDFNALAESSTQWNELWQRSPTHNPAVRAEPLAAWLDSFATRAALRAIVVEADGRFVAALPLVLGFTKRARHGSRLIARLPNNHWGCCGDLLVDPEADLSVLARHLVEGIRDLGPTILYGESLLTLSARWQALAAELAVAHFAVEVRDQWRVGLVDIGPDWKGYHASRSRNHRRKLTVCFDRLKEAGGGQLQLYDRLAPEEVVPLVRRGFEVEQRSWKSTSGRAVMHEPRALEFYSRLMTALAAGGYARLSFLEVAGQPAAFEYGFAAKGVYFCPKVGYDEAFAALSPGQLIRAMLFERFAAEGTYRLVDFSGPLVDATSKWATRDQYVGRLLAGRGLLGQAVTTAFRTARSLYRRARRRPDRVFGDEIEIRPGPGVKAARPQRVDNQPGEPATVTPIAGD
ncbi:MAG: GNAT family N-acetyltransferase [Pirellulales bacterium]|nr:GNAT family N-acetyltransferase [Pirellulales bacterium]